MVMEPSVPVRSTSSLFKKLMWDIGREETKSCLVA
jgi:hypothetical protein